jgi:hypothetical protein
MGNVVAGEALRRAAQEKRGQIVQNYVASQAAVPVDCYQKNIFAPLIAKAPADALGTLAIVDGGHPETPNVYGDWLDRNRESIGRRVNFHNVNDYALASNRWQLNQYFKPDQSDFPALEWSYGYAPPNNLAVLDPKGFYKFKLINDHLGERILLQAITWGDAAAVKDAYEIMAFAAEARTMALGSVGNVQPLDQNVSLLENGADGQKIWPADGSPLPYSAHKWHSAQFRSTNMRQWRYWKELLGPRGFRINQ